MREIDRLKVYKFILKETKHEYSAVEDTTKYRLRTPYFNVGMNFDNRGMTQNINFLMKNDIPEQVFKEFFFIIKTYIELSEKLKYEQDAILLKENWDGNVQTVCKAILKGEYRLKDYKLFFEGFYENTRSTYGASSKQI